MLYAVGDKVVHARYGPGRISRVEQQEMVDGLRGYYVIEMMTRRLTVRVPVLKADEADVRPAMPPSAAPEVLKALRSRPQRLPDDPKVRQELVEAKAKTGAVMELAGLVRDLAWHGARAHLTRNDSDSLKHGQELLAAEMALVSGGNVAELIKLITSTLSEATRAGA